MALRYGGVFEQGNIRYLLSSSSFTDPVVEGDYNTWTFQWQQPVLGRSNGHYLSAVDYSALIDEKNERIVSYWLDKTSGGVWISRFGIFDLLTGSSIFASPENTPYLSPYPEIGYYPRRIVEGMVEGDRDDDSYSGSISRSIQTYMLVRRSDTYTLEVWRGDATPRLTLDFRNDIQTPLIYQWVNIRQFGISLTGKYILLMIWNHATPTPPFFYWMLYEGSYVEP